MLTNPTWRVLTPESLKRAEAAPAVAEIGNEVVALNQHGEQDGDPLIVSDSPWVREVAMREADVACV